MGPFDVGWSQRLMAFLLRAPFFLRLFSSRAASERKGIFMYDRGKVMHAIVSNTFFTSNMDDHTGVMDD